MKTKRTARAAAFLVTMGVAAMLTGNTAMATLSFTLNNGNTALSGLSAPFGSVSVTLANSTTATVTLTAASGYAFGDGSALGLNLADTGVTMSDLAFVARLGNSQSPALAGVSSGNVDGFGSFNYQIDLQGGYGGSVTGLSFTLTKSSGTWTSESDILLLNGLTGLSGYDVVGHVMNIADGGNTTGYAAGTLVPVPEAGTIIACALLLLPMGASTLRILRKSRIAPVC